MLIYDCLVYYIVYIVGVKRLMFVVLETCKVRQGH